MQIVMAMYLLICFNTYVHKMILRDFLGEKYLSEQHWQMCHIRLHGCSGTSWIVHFFDPTNMSDTSFLYVIYEVIVHISLSSFFYSIPNFLV